VSGLTAVAVAKAVSRTVNYSNAKVTDRSPKAIAALSLIAGAAAAFFYHRRGLTLSHYDAKAHLVVARRVLDSLTPEYSQIGAVWLPLPHVLNLVPVQVDAFYRTGASAVAISVLSFSISCYAIARLVLSVTESRVAAALSAAIFATQPDVLYLQSTPMTEPLLFGLVLLSITLVHDWVESDAHKSPRAAGLSLICACLTRYEAWIVTAVLLSLAAIALWRRGRPMITALKAAAQLAVYPVVAIVCFFFHSWFTTGAWFVTGGFFVPDNIAHQRPYTAILAVVYGMGMLVGRPLVAIAFAGAIAVLWRGFKRPGWAASLVVLALVAFMVLPAYAFYEGHPFRIRYMIAPAVGVIVFVGMAIGMLRGWRRLAAALTVAVWVAATVRPLNPLAPMVQEAQWDRPFSFGRRHVTECLMRNYHGERILASMGSLAHYMQELSHEGINIRDFVHEGNLKYWQEAIEAPQDLVGWILVEERAEGGDTLATRARQSSAFLTGFTRVCSDGGVTLYKAVATH
jgi:hypothetical protein